MARCTATLLWPPKHHVLGLFDDHNAFHVTNRNLREESEHRKMLGKLLNLSKRFNGPLEPTLDDSNGSPCPSYPPPDAPTHRHERVHGRTEVMPIRSVGIEVMMEFAPYSD